MYTSRLVKYWAWLVVIGCVGFYSIPVGMIGNTAGLYVAPVMDTFGWDQTNTTMYRTIQPIVAAICTPIAGRLLAKYSARWILTATSLAFGLASVGTAFATELWQWNLYGVIYGVCSGFFMYLAAPVLVNRWFRKSAGLALGITAATLSVLTAIVAPVAQGLIDSVGWQQSRVIIFGIATVASVAITVIFVRDNPQQVGAEPYGAGEVSTAEDTPAVVTADQGATRTQALRSPGLYLVILIACIIVMTAAFGQQIPAYTARSPLGAGTGAVAVSVIMIGGTVGKLLLGWLADYVGIKPTAVGSLLTGAVGIFVGMIATSPLVFYVGMIAFGFGYAGLTVIVPLLVRSAFGSRTYPEIFSWVSMGIFISTSVSFLIYGRIYDLTGSYTGGFIFVIVMYVIGAALVVPAVNLSRKAWVGKTEGTSSEVGV
ncbi:MAG: MFS transporter [Propioniciclava sp.]